MIHPKISKEKLIIFSTDNNDKVTGYKINLEDIAFDNSITNELKGRLDQLRRFSRVNRNLQKAMDSFEQIELLLKQYGPHSGFGLIPHSLFCHAVILYGACFVKGEDDRYPLRELYLETCEHPIHKEIMVIRNKRFGHIDENHGVRTDEILWQFRVNDEILIPEASAMRGSSSALPSVSSLCSFKGWIQALSEKVCLSKAKIETEIKVIVGSIQIEE